MYTMTHYLICDSFLDIPLISYYLINRIIHYKFNAIAHDSVLWCYK